MARARNIKPAFFKNEFLAQLPAEVQLLFIGLWTLADRDGRLEDRPIRIKGEIFPYTAVDVNKGLAMLASCSADQDEPFIVRYSSGGKKCIQILNWGKHQHPHPNEPKSDIPEFKEGLQPLVKVLQPLDEGHNDTQRIAQADSLLSDSLSSLNTKATNVALSDVPETGTPVPPTSNGSGHKFKLTSGDDWELPHAKLTAYEKTYGDRLTVTHELEKAAIWLDDNTQRRPRSGKGCQKFLTSWLNRADERARKQPVGSNMPPPPKQQQRIARPLTLEEIQNYNATGTIG